MAKLRNFDCPSETEEEDKRRGVVPKRKMIKRKETQLKEDPIVAETDGIEGVGRQETGIQET